MTVNVSVLTLSVVVLVSISAYRLCVVPVSTDVMTGLLYAIPLGGTEERAPQTNFDLLGLNVRTCIATISSSL